MRKLYSILFITILVCFVGAVVFLILAPDQIPVHMGFSGDVDRVGSKFEYLIFPAITAGMGVFFFLMAKVEQKKTEGSNEKVILYVGNALLILLTALGFYFMVKAIRYDPENATSVDYDDMNKLIGVGVGALMVVLGNIMPKARKNSMFGIRTTWSMYSDSVWQKSQRFGGIVCVIGGIALILLSALLPGSWNTAVKLVIIAVVAIVASGASYKYYSQERRNGL